MKKNRNNCMIRWQLLILITEEKIFEKPRLWIYSDLRIQNNWSWEEKLPNFSYLFVSLSQQWFYFYNTEDRTEESGLIYTIYWGLLDSLRRFYRDINTDAQVGIILLRSVLHSFCFLGSLMYCYFRRVHLEKRIISRADAQSYCESVKDFAIWPWS